ncbi:MAG: porin, partial [Planctomycetota bacterium]
LGQDWLTKQRAAEIRGLVQDVLADADTRASLLQGATAGYDGGFFIGSADGDFLLKITGQIQTRYVYNRRDMPPGDGDENRYGFEIRRAKVKFGGHIINPRWTYKIDGAFNRNGGDLEVEDAWIAYDFENGWSVKAGQYKAPFAREELVSSSKQLAVERSLMNEAFTGNRTQGVMVTYKGDQFRVMGSLDDGFDNGDFGGGVGNLDLNATNVGWNVETVEGSFTARGEFLFTGEWKQFKDFTSKPDSENAAMAGVAFHYQKDEFGTASGPEEEILALTLDFSWEGNGYNVFIAWSYADLDVQGRSPFGLMAHGGYYLTDMWEIFGRWEYLDYDEAGLSEPNIITLGVNGYFNSKIKGTLDFGYATESIVGVSSSTGWEDDTVGNDGQFVLRAQMQLLF